MSIQLSIESDEIGAFLGGLLCAQIKSEYFALATAGGLQHVPDVPRGTLLALARTAVENTLRAFEGPLRDKLLAQLDLFAADVVGAEIVDLKAG